MDNLVFEEAVNAEIDQSEFISRKWIYVNDNNSQNYTSQVILDTTPLSNAGGYVNWSEGYIVMPLVVQLTSATAASLPVLDASANTQATQSWALKNGFWNMINSMSVEFNNQNIVQQTPFLNVFRSFKALTSFSADDVKNEGATIGFAPDTASSWGFCPYGAVNTNFLLSSGVGLSNNRHAPVYRQDANATYLNTAYSGDIDAAGKGVGLVPDNVYVGSKSSHNRGFAERQSYLTYNPTISAAKGSAVSNLLVGSATGQGCLNQGSLMNNASCLSLYRSAQQTQTQDGSIIWNVYAKLRLKDIADYFSKTPLLKGSTMRFYINTNQAVQSFTLVKGAGISTATPTYDALTFASPSVLGGLTNPLQIASAQLGNALGNLPADTYTLSCSIVKNTNSSQSAYTLGQSPLTACRLYCPVYKFNPIAEQRYLSLAPTKRVEYTDIFQYQFSGIGAGSNFNFLVTNGIQDIQSVLVVPFLTAGASATASGTAWSTLLASNSTSGATPDPVPLTNFNVLVSGVNLFLNNQLYDYEQFNQELKSSNQLNGNLTTGLTSGLISEDDFSKGMRYYYGNCARILPSEVGVSRSVQIIGQNASSLSCDIMVFVEFKRRMTIDIQTGARLE